MRYYADLHVHSKYSRACSRDCDLAHLARGARRKGISLVGTGDFTHPAWWEHLRDTLVPAEPGLFRLRDDLDREVLRTLPRTCHRPVRFMLQVEISTIYKRGDFTRKVHHICYAPDFDAAARFSANLAKIGNLKSDGRPILGLDSRDLLEITLDCGPGAYLVPAHIWTPWFAVLGSKSGFDAVNDCYDDLAEHVFAVETGLSSDPEMNWRVPSLDRFRLVSNSDAHSPPMLGRNATVFDTDLDYHAVRRALRTGAGYVGTVDMFPEEGKYHLDGHRKCGVRFEPAETKARQCLCPECGRPLTVGVLHRVDSLAGRPPGERPATAGEPLKIVPLPELVGELFGVGPKSKRVQKEVDEIVAALGPELPILLELPLDEVRQAGRSPLLVEAIERLRTGRVRREAGYDGEYGTIGLFEPGEVALGERSPALFDLAESEPLPVAAPAVKARVPAPRSPEPDLSRPAPTKAVQAARAVGANAPAPNATTKVPSDPEEVLLTGLDPEQRSAAATVDGQLLIVAGPGTGKTRTLTHRLAHLVTAHGAPPEHCLAITFTRRAAAELRERLTALVPEQAPRITVSTFHALGMAILREHHDRLGLAADFGIADDEERLGILRELLGGSAREARRAMSGVSLVKRSAAAEVAARAAGEPGRPSTAEANLVELAERYDAALREVNLVDFDDLIAQPVLLLARHTDLVGEYRDRFRWISVDEYQDVDELQYRLLRQLTPAHGNLCVIGDPDQAIYSFRGADVGFFLRFQQDFASARSVQLVRNYRSSPVVVAGAVAAIAPSTLVPGRALHAMGGQAGDRDRIGLYPAADEAAEAKFVVRTIDTLLGGATFHSLDSGRVRTDGVAGGLSFNDIAVLYRTDAQTRPVMAELAREGLPYQKRSHDRLSDHPGVRALLRQMPATGDGFAGTVPDLLAALSQGPLPQSPAVAPPAGEEIEGATGAALREAVGLLAPLAARHAGDLDGFRAEISLGAEVDTWDPRADRISLLTLHAAKGLEFPVVFLIGCSEGLLPFRWPGEQDADSEAEERRLFFVGISRARSHLYLSYPRSRSRSGRDQPAAPSPFLDALGGDLVERIIGAPRGSAAPRARQLRLL